MEKVDELDYLMTRFNVFYDYAMKSLNATPNVHNEQTINIYVEHYKKPTELAYAKKNIKLLRSINKEISSFLIEWREDEKKELAEWFKEKLGEDIYLLDAKFLKKIETIKRRGEIKTPVEHQLVARRIDQIFQKDDMVDETELLKEIEADYINKM